MSVFDILLRCLYPLGRAYGLVPFRLRGSDRRITASRPQLIYAAAYCVSIAVALPLIQYAYFNAIFMAHKKLVVKIVVALDLCVSTVRPIYGTAHHSLHGRRMRAWVARLWQLRRRLLSEPAIYAESPTATGGRRRTLPPVRRSPLIGCVAGVSMALQLAIVVLNGAIFCGPWVLQLQHWTVLVAAHGYAIVATGVYFCAIYAVLLLAERVNERLAQLCAGVCPKIRLWDERLQPAPESRVYVGRAAGRRLELRAGMGLKYQLSEDIEQLSGMYDCLAEVLAEINRFYAGHLLLALVCAFSYSFSGVSCVFGYATLYAREWLH